MTFVHGDDVLIAARLVGSVTLPIALATKPVTHCAAVLPIAECNQALAVKSLPCLQHQGRCLMRPWMTYTH